MKRRTIKVKGKENSVKVSKQDRSNEINLFKLGTLVQFETHAWQAVKRLPKDVVKELGKEGKDLSGWIRANKSLINRDTLQNINGLIWDARQLILNVALPFPIKGVYFVPNEKITELNESLTEKNKEFKKEVKEFVEQYDEHIEAAEESLGDYFNESDYPRNIAERFSIYWRFFELTIPTNITEELYEEESERFHSLMEETKQMGIMALREGFAEIVSHLTDTISGKIDGQRRRLRQDAIDKVSDFFNTFQSKNVFKDDELQTLIEKAKDVMEGVTVKEINTDEELAKELNEELKTIDKELTASTEKIRRRMSFKL